MSKEYRGRNAIASAGIDEAGLGPILGPLSVASCSAYGPVDLAELPQWLRDAGIWPPLPEPLAKQSPRVLADSKQIYRRHTDLARLEEAALSLYLASYHSQGLETKLRPQEIFGTAERCQLRQLPWYAEFFSAESSIPLLGSAAEIRRRAGHLAVLLGQRGISLLLEGRLLSERAYNQRIAQLDNKSLVLRGLIGELIQHFAHSLGQSRQPDQQSDRQQARCVVDRIGGLKYYRDWLGSIFSGQIAVVDEQSHCSEYWLRPAGGPPFGLAFWVGGDRQHVLCALASLWAKYRRELLMWEFNRYWSSYAQREHGYHLPRTSGYWRDGRRFAAELEGLLEGGLPEDLLRSR